MKPEAIAEDFDAVCPECGSSQVKLVSVGDPSKAGSTNTTKAVDISITVMEFLQFLSCRGCGHSWNLPLRGSA